MSGLDEWPSHLNAQFTQRLSQEWQAYHGTDLSLKQCFSFVKYKMNVLRNMHVLADDAERRAFCVALYEYTHRVLAPSNADTEFIDNYHIGMGGRQRGPPGRDAEARNPLLSQLPADEP